MNYSKFEYLEIEDKNFGCVFDAVQKFKKTNKNYRLHIYKNELSFDSKILKKFCITMTRWGFPVTLVEEGDYFIVTFLLKGYKSDKHWLAAFSMIRYAVKCKVVFTYNDWKTEGVIPMMYELKKKYRNLDLFQCFQVASYKVLPGSHCGSHSCGNTVGTLLSAKEMKAKGKTEYMTNLFFREPIKKYQYYWKSFHKLINKNEKEAIKELV